MFKVMNPLQLNAVDFILTVCLLRTFDDSVDFEQMWADDWL